MGWFFRNIWMIFFACVLLGSLAACSHTTVPVCPAIVPYTAEQQIQVADELETLPPDAMTRRFMTDYGVLRARLRECQP